MKENFWQKLKLYFLPHPTTHQKAKLLSWNFLLVYILIFLLLRTGIEGINTFRPGVLGVTSNITVQQVIDDTNKERQKLGLKPLKENQALDAAAAAKAQNMFAENYWAHYSPSGKDPWEFILNAGYKFSYAGENLARNFYNSSDVVTAWMNSTSHRENLLNSHYQDIGIAVVEGVLDGQKTTLVVQMFGSPSQPIAQQLPSQISDQGKSIAINSALPAKVAGTVAGSENHPSAFRIDPYTVTRGVGLALIGLLAMLIVLDYLALKRRGVFRISSHHLAHLSILSLAAATLLTSRIGEIL